jgi:predicted nucleic acid-binding protein
MVVIDATMLLLLLRPDAGVPKDSEGKEIPDFQARLAYWIETTEAAGTKIIIPTPALSEALVRSGKAGPKIVEKIKEYAVFQIAAFDELEAIEVAAMTKADIDAGDKRGGASKESTWAKIKYDRQIVAIAKVAQATIIYTDDGDIRAFAKKVGISTIRLEDLPLKPLPPQQDLPFDANSVPDVTDKEVAAAEALLAANLETEDDAEEKDA